MAPPLCLDGNAKRSPRSDGGDCGAVTGRLCKSRSLVNSTADVGRGLCVYSCRLFGGGGGSATAQCRDGVEPLAGPSFFAREELAEAIVLRAELGPRSREKPALLPSLATLLLGCRILKGHWAGCICSAALKVSSGWACHGEKTLNPRAARPSADSCSVSGSQAAGSTHDARG